MSKETVNKRSQDDGFSIAASPSLQSHACCGRYITKGVVVNYLSFLALLILSFNANACMVPPEGLTEKNIQQFLYLLTASAVLLPLVFIVRFAHNKMRLWVPTIAVLAFLYIPFTSYILEYAGLSGFGGACGRPGLVHTGQVLLIGIIVIFAYELFKYFKHRRTL